ncbi:MAG TPA: hypothetical protein VGX28_04940 [Frankiaceae bacterium]|jgi:hypothetical protein|nr:hypothetical protein [Frankiaceae bacterium]
MRRTRRAGRASCVVALLLPALALGTPAHADVPTEMGLAIAETNVAIGDAAVDVALANVENPNITCGIPTAYGMAVTPAADAYAAEVRGVDVGVGQGDCASRTVMTYTGTLVLTIQYRDPSGAWADIPGCEGRSTMTAVNGVVVVVAVVPCRYQHGDTASGRPHRVHAVLTHSLGDQQYAGFSEPWQG